MIVVDTSVWVTALRSATSRESTVLQALLDADEVVLPIPVRVELLSGVSNKDRPALRRGLSALPLSFPTDDTWNLVDAWIERAGQSGERFGVGDLLIAALAKESGAFVWSLDADFTRMARLDLIELYDLPRMRP